MHIGSISIFRRFFMALFNNVTDSRPSAVFNHLDGLPSFSFREPTKVIFDTQRKELIMTDKETNKISRLRFSQLHNVGVIKGQDIILSEHNVVGGAVLGGLLFGPLGAIVGGMAGNSVKQIQKNAKCFVVNYSPVSSPDDIRVISFEIPVQSADFANALWGSLRPYCKKSRSAASSSYL